MTTALVLTGGGARGAYQVGVLSELLPWLEEQGRRPTVLCGASVGAINATALAAKATVPAGEAADALTTAWTDLRKGDVLRPVITQIPAIIGRYLSELTPMNGDRLRGFIDTDPLATTLRRWIDWDDVATATAPQGPVDSLMVLATHVVSGTPTAFVAGECPESDDSVPRYVATDLTVEHVVASASIPLLFNATRVDAPAEVAGWYCDGSTRLNRPLAPALATGADDVIVVSTNAPHRTHQPAGVGDETEPDLGDVLVNVLDAVMTDPLVEDLDRGAGGADITVFAPDHPSQLASIAQSVMNENHRGFTALLRSDYPLLDWALGGDSPRQAELLSYLLFDHDFITTAIELGAADVRQRLPELAT